MPVFGVVSRLLVVAVSSTRWQAECGPVWSMDGAPGARRMKDALLLQPISSSSVAVRGRMVLMEQTAISEW